MQSIDIELLELASVLDLDQASRSPRTPLVRLFPRARWVRLAAKALRWTRQRQQTAFEMWWLFQVLIMTLIIGSNGRIIGRPKAALCGGGVARSFLRRGGFRFS